MAISCAQVEYFEEGFPGGHGFLQTPLVYIGKRQVTPLEALQGADLPGA